MEKNKPLLRAQYYHEEARKMRDIAISEGNEARRKIILEIADAYDELARQIVAEVKVARLE